MHKRLVLSLLSQPQVLAPNFGYHTINAIKAETTREEAPLSLEEAFAKYRNLNNIQVEAMTGLGLSRQQGGFTKQFRVSHYQCN